ncbi:3-keto-5-aminohexanoate cleavage protein [Roseovarius sp. 2305UL8-3]|uniref:3-keto-5-aminohexanoate cleavage protein n=1 Tax=Roseovarius conchicola TaxID=3121636 RepID=UPI003527B427
MPLPYVLVSTTGSRKTPCDHHALPITTGGIVAEAQACFAAGANGIHLHVRDSDGQHSLDPGRYRETMIELARIAPRLEVQITTEAGGHFDVETQLVCLQQVAPEWASISVREINRDPALANRIYAVCADQGTRVQHILFDAEDEALLDRWQADDTVRAGQTDRLLVLGRYSTGQRATPADLSGFGTPEKQNCTWMACAFGAREHDCLEQAAHQGGDVRVGFENSTTQSDGTPWVDNAASVAALVARLKGNTA